MNESDLQGMITAAYAERERMCRSYFEAENTRLADLCLLMARRFIRGGP